MNKTQIDVHKLCKSLGIPFTREERVEAEHRLYQTLGIPYNAEERQQAMHSLYRALGVPFTPEEKAELQKKVYDALGILKPKFGTQRRIPRPDGWMKNPYIGNDGRDYHGVEALRQANAEHNDRMYQKKPINIDKTPIKRMDDLR